MLDRRSFLRSIGGGSAGAVLAFPLMTGAEANDPRVEEAKARYRETDHVKQFYRTNRYETL